LIPKRYIGITNNLTTRLKKHRTPNSRVYRMLGDFDLINTENHPDYNSARKRELLSLDYYELN